MQSSEVFSIIGFPARLAGRLLVFARFVWGRSAPFKPASEYCLERFGPSYRRRPWLLYDVGELRSIEHLINNGSDEDVSAFRKAQLASGASTMVVVSLLNDAVTTPAE